MWKDSIRNIVVIFQTNILRIVGFYVRHSAIDRLNSISLFCINGETIFIFLNYVGMYIYSNKQNDEIRNFNERLAHH